MTSRTRALKVAQQALRLIAALNFIGVGILHFTHAHIFALMMPPMLPWPMALIYVSGVFEILGGVGLLVPPTRRMAAWGLLALLVAVFPANIYMAVAHVELPLTWLPQSEAGRWIRLPFQAVIAAEVWFAGLYVIDGDQPSSR